MLPENSLYQADLDQTRQNRDRLLSNANLLYWYGKLYQDQFRGEPDLKSKRILEIGSGASPLRLFVPNLTTSDILALEHLDVVFDCHQIAELDAIADHSLDVITLTNVLHHLRDPLAFLRGATKKLSHGGRVYMAEPYFSLLSTPMYKLLHHEPSDFSISRPLLSRVEGPLSTSNQAMPHMIFFSRPDWLAELSDVYDTKNIQLSYFTGLAYPITGGINRCFPVPGWLYRHFFAVDRMLARKAPSFFASFFIARLVAR